MTVSWSLHEGFVLAGIGRIYAIAKNVRRKKRLQNFSRYVMNGRMLETRARLDMGVNHGITDSCSHYHEPSQTWIPDYQLRFDRLSIAAYITTSNEFHGLMKIVASDGGRMMDEQR